MGHMFPPPLLRRSTIHPARFPRSAARTASCILCANSVSTEPMPLNEPTLT